MKIIKTSDPQIKPSTVMMVYGEGGVGKTTFASTAPKPLLADCENGSKYLGLRGISIDVAQIEKWSDMREFFDYAVKNDYQTIVIDPIGELMEKLKKFMVAMNDLKNVQKDGNPTMAGWGWIKKTFKDYIRLIRDSGKNVILVAHVEEINDEGRLVKRPKIETKIADDIINMIDVVGYMTSIQQDGEAKRIIIVDPGSEKYKAKDRTGQLGKIIEPDFTKIVNACQGTASYSWSKPVVEEPPKKEDKKLSNPHLQAAKEKLEAQIGEVPVK